jgi:hypothetical protein
MSISPSLKTVLQRTLGDESAEELVTTLNDTRSTLEALRADIAEMRHEMRTGFITVELKIERTRADLIKWSFVFWVSAVTAIAALAGVLRN